MQNVQTAAVRVKHQYLPPPTLSNIDETAEVVAATAAALEDPIRDRGESWWFYFWAVRKLPALTLTALVADAERVKANGGMLRTDGGGQRTLGGIFFQLVRTDLGPERWQGLLGAVRRYYIAGWVSRLQQRPEGPPASRAEVAAVIQAAGETPRDYAVDRIAAAVVPRPAKSAAPRKLPPPPQNTKAVPKPQRRPPAPPAPAVEVSYARRRPAGDEA